MNLILYLAAAAIAPRPIRRRRTRPSSSPASREPVEAFAGPGHTGDQDGAERQRPGRPRRWWPTSCADSRSLSVAVSGPRGSQTQVRIRGAEANHTLLFVDGIRFNDPAAGNEARFELLTVDGLDRIDIMRGPAIGLVGIGGDRRRGRVHTNQPHGPGPSLEALAEYGGLDSRRLSATGRGRRPAGSSSRRTAGLAGERGHRFVRIRTGDRDGFENRSASFKAVLRPSTRSSSERSATGSTASQRI